MGNRWRLFLLDLIFFIYNLAYPALLGSFFYAVFFYTQDPNKAPRTCWDIFGQVLVIAIFGLDFVWGRKFYEWIKEGPWKDSKPTSESLILFVCAETVTLCSLCLAFKASAGSPHYYWSIGFFALAVLTMFHFQDQESLRSSSGRILRFLLAGCIAEATLVQWSGSQMLFRAGLFVLAGVLIAYYCFSTDERWQIKAISPSGSLIDNVL